MEEKTQEQRSFGDFYNYLVTNFCQGMKLLFSTHDTKVNIINATYNQEQKRYYMEFEFTDEEGLSDMRSEFISKEDVN